MTTDLAISIINHSNPEMLRDCIRSIYSARGLSPSPGTPGEGRGEGDLKRVIILDAPNHPHPDPLPEYREREPQIEIWVVDNATDQRLVQEIQYEFPDVKWIFNPKRLGFSANHNQVLSQASARYLCILNDDTLIHENAIAQLVKFMDEHPKAGMAGPRLLNRDGSIQNSTFRRKSVTGELIDILQLPGKLIRLKLRGIDPAQFTDKEATVDWLLGACIVIRRETLEQAGVLDDVLSPIANCEEVDWCDRVRKCGWDVCFVPQAKVTHFGGQSLKSASIGADRFRVEMHRVVIAYFAKQHGLFSSLLVRAVYILSLPWNAFMLGQSALRGHMEKSEAKSVWATLLGIAAIAMRPLPKPFCRVDEKPAVGANAQPAPPAKRTALIT